MAHEMTRIAVELEQLERPALVEMPHLIGRDAVPAARRAAWKKEVDRRERRARTTSIGRNDLRRGAMHLAVEATLRVRAKVEGGDQLAGAGMHWTERLPTAPLARAPVPVRELRLVTRVLEIGDAVAQESLRVAERRVVDRRADLLEDELEEELCGKLAQLEVEFLGAVAAERADCPGGRFLVERNRHGGVSGWTREVSYVVALFTSPSAGHRTVSSVHPPSVRQEWAYVGPCQST